MSLLEQTPGLLEALRVERTPKFFATRSGDGVPNVVPLLSLRLVDDRPDTLIFAHSMLRKSIQNVKQDPRAAILVVAGLRGWLLKADFLEMQTKGDHFEQLVSSAGLRYNPYGTIRGAGVVRIRAVEMPYDLPPGQVAEDARLAQRAAWSLGGTVAGGAKMPRVVRREFARRDALKVLSWLGADGYPVVVPALSLWPAGDTALVCRKGQGQLPAPAEGTFVASNVLSADGISYQAKGDWIEQKKNAAIRIQEIYIGGPPFPGGRVV